MRNAITALLGLQAQADEDEDDDDFDDDEDDDDEADEGDDDGGATIQARGALPPIDDALDRHLTELAPSTLTHLFRKRSSTS